MPDFTYVAEVAAATDILANWRYRKVPYPALVTMMVSHEELSNTMRVMTGTTEVVQADSPVTKGTVEVLPVPNTTPVFQFTAAYNDEVTCVVSADLAGKVMAWVNIERLPGQ